MPPPPPHTHLTKIPPPGPQDGVGAKRSRGAHPNKDGAPAALHHTASPIGVCWSLGLGGSPMELWGGWGAQGTPYRGIWLLPSPEALILFFECPIGVQLCPIPHFAA